MPSTVEPEVCEQIRTAYLAGEHTNRTIDPLGRTYLARVAEFGVTR
jgi:hypothetical protein